MNHKIKILIGDDTAEFGVSLASTLRGMGFYVLARPKDGEKLLEAIKSEQPDVAVIDAVMPGLDAIELMKKLNAKNGNKPHIVVVSSFDNPLVERMVMELGAAYYMRKPFEAKSLGERINAIMGVGLSDEPSLTLTAQKLRSISKLPLQTLFTA